MLKLSGWVRMKINGNYHLKSFQPPYSQPRIEVIVSASLEFTILGFGWSLPSHSPVYEQYKRSLRQVRLSALLGEIKKMDLCEGLSGQVVRSIDHLSGLNPSHLNTEFKISKNGLMETQ